MDDLVNKFKECNSEFQKMRFIESFYDKLRDHSPETLTSFFCEVIAKEKNAVVRHEAVFLLGMGADYLRKYEEAIVGKLIQIAKKEKSTVVLHEIIEALGHFHSIEAVNFVNEMLKHNNADIYDTAVISAGRHSFSFKAE